MDEILSPCSDINSYSFLPAGQGMFHDGLRDLMHHIDGTDDVAGGVADANSSAAGNVAVVHAIIKEASTDTTMIPESITIDANLAPLIESASAGSVHEASWALYNAAKDKHFAATVGKKPPLTLKGEKFCLNCTFYGKLCGQPEVLTLLGCVGGPSFKTLERLEIGGEQLKRLNELFKAEVATPTFAVAHPISQGVECPIFPPTTECFLLPPTQLGNKLRQWKGTASAKSKAKSKSTEKP
jgi:hypothetical protein